MLLMDRGVIAQLLKAAGLPAQDSHALLGEEPSPPEFSPTYGPLRGAMPVRRASAGVMPDETQGVPMSLLAGAAPQSAPPAPRPSLGRRVAEGIRGLLGGNEMPAGYEGLFTPEDLNRVKSSVPRALFNLLGGHTEGEVQKERLQELYATRQATQLKAREQAVFERFAPDGTEDSDELNMKVRRLQLALAAIGSPHADKLGSMIASGHLMPQAVKPVTPLHIPKGSLVPDGRGGWVPASPEEAESYEERPERGGVAIYTNGQFKAWKIRPPAERDPDSTRQANYENSLRAKYFATPAVDQAAKLANAYQGIMAAAEDANPQTSLAMMYEAVKMRDPNAVREGELALQRAARSVPGWIYGLWEKAAKGNLLTPVERQQIVTWAGDKLVQQRKLVQPVRESFWRQADRFKAERDFVAPDPFDGISVPGDRRGAAGTSAALTDAQVAEAMAAGADTPAKVREYWAKKKP